MSQGSLRRLALPAAGSLAAGALMLGMPSASADDHSVLGKDGGALILVLDGSGSMKESAGGQTKMQAAQQGLRRVIDSLPGRSKVGLRVYGSRVSDGPGSCTDSQLLVPVQTADKSRLKAGVNKLKPLGNTPIAYSLKKAYADLPATGKRSIVLVSDGEENCGGDPCKVARDLKKKGADFYIDAVGLKVDSTSRSQLTCIASAGGGTYYDVSDLKDLASTLTRTSIRAARGYQEAGLPVEGATSASSDAPELEDGQWLDTIGDSGTEFYTVPDPGKGTLHVSASTRTTSPELSATEGLKIALTSSAGTACGESELTTVQGSVNQRAPYAVSLTSTPQDREDCGQGPYVVSVEPPEIQGVKPLEVLVRTEPAVDSVDGLPGAVGESGYSDSATAAQPATGTPQVALGSPSFAGAPPVQPGAYKDKILPGETLLYRVPDVAWGQQPICDFSLQRTRAAARALKGDGYFEAAIGNVYGPMKDKLTDDSADKNLVHYAGDEAYPIHVAAPQVRYQNRTVTATQIHGADLDGDYYCALTLFTSTPSVDAKVGEVPFTLKVALNGTLDQGKPAYTSSPKNTANDKQTKPGTHDASDGVDTGWLIGGAVVVLGILAALAAWLRRRASGESSA